jgi:hypothetical protein
MDLKNKYWLILGGVSILTIGGLLITLRKKKSGGSTKSSSDFKNKLVDLANSEWNKWNKGGKRIKEGSKETIEDLRKYWEEGAGVKQNDKYYINEAWSSAFISYLMRKAGAGDDFKYAQSHSQYIAEAVKNRKENNSKKFKAYKPEEVDVKVGDLVCYPRQGGITYDSSAGYKSHCDLVTEINGNVAVGIGGNISDSVTKKNYYLSNGKIDKNKSKDVFVVIKNLK